MTTDKLHPSICVIIINFNSDKDLAKCLQCLDKQVFKDFCTIVIDNSEIGNKNDFSNIYDSNIHLINNHRNIGFASGNNIAIKETNADWIALLNPDAFPEPTWLSNLMLATKKFPNYSFFASRLLSAKKPWLLDGAGDNYHFSGLIWRHGHGFSDQQITFSEPIEVFSPCAASALYRRLALEQVGGFDEDFFCYAEDVDLGFRLRLQGHRCLFVPEAVSYHVGSATTGNRSVFSMYHGHRNLVWAYVKNMPMPLFLIFLPAHIILNVFSLIWFTIMGQRKTIIRSKMDAIKGIPRIWRKRKQIQAERRVNWKEILRVLSFRLPAQP
jgi:GT2 family glycosyltransferase